MREHVVQGYGKVQNSKLLDYAFWWGGGAAQTHVPRTTVHWKSTEDGPFKG